MGRNGQGEVKKFQDINFFLCRFNTESFQYLDTWIRLKNFFIVRSVDLNFGSKMWIFFKIICKKHFFKCFKAYRLLISIFYLIVWSINWSEKVKVNSIIKKDFVRISWLNPVWVDVFRPPLSSCRILRGSRP